MTEELVSKEVCELRGKLYSEKLSGLECEITGIKEQQKSIRDDIKGVYDLQRTILYAIIGLFGTSILILFGVIAGRAIDFKFFFP